MRAKKKGMWQRVNLVVQVVVTLAILTVIGALAVGHNLRFDLTSTKRYTLSPQSIKVLKALKEEVKAIAFFQEGSEERKAARDLLEQYRYASSRFSYELVDPDRRPQMAKKYEIASYGTVAVECSGRVEKIFDLNKSSEIYTLSNRVRRMINQEPNLLIFSCAAA